MKLAIFISGLFRKYNNTLPSLLYFCKFYSIDIFLIIDNSENTSDIQNVIKLLNPKKIKYIDSKNDCNNVNMWFKIKLGYELIKQYEKNNNIKYDYYIRCRYDILIEHFKIDFNKLKDDTIYFGIRNYWSPMLNNIYPIHDIICDEFFFGNRKIMDIFCYFHDIVIKSKNRCLKVNIPEVQLKYLLKIYNLKYKILKIKYKYACYSELDCIKYHCKKYNVYRGFVFQTFIKLIYFIVIILNIYIISKYYRQNKKY